MVTVDMVLRGGETVTSHADAKPYADGGLRYVRITGEEGGNVALIFTGSDEDIGVAVDILTGHLQRIKASLPIGVR